MDWGVYVVSKEYLTPLENNHWVRKPNGTWKEVHDVPPEDLDGLEVLDSRAGDKVQGGVFLGINDEGLARVETPDEEVVEVDPLSLKVRPGFKRDTYVKVADEPLFYRVDGEDRPTPRSSKFRGQIVRISRVLDNDGNYLIELSGSFYRVHKRFLTPEQQQQWRTDV